MGLIDIIWTYAITPIKDSTNSDNSWHRKIMDENQSEVVMIFLSWRPKIKSFKKLYSCFPQQTKLIYRLPNTVLSGNLEAMQRSWEEVTRTINRDLANYNVKTVFGISIGTSPALYAANRSASVENVILSLAGHSIAPVMWNSPVTKAIVREAVDNGLTVDDLHSVLSPYDQINNIDNLQGKDIRMYLAQSDSIIPPESAQILLDEMEKQQLKPKVTKVGLVGHYVGGVHSIFFPDWFIKKR